MGNLKNINQVDVHAIDERVQLRLAENGEEVAILTADPEWMEELVDLIQEAIEVAKKSEYYQPKKEED